jgi:hypothetical protein
LILDIQQVREMNYESSVEFLREIASNIEENLGTQAPSALTSICVVLPQNRRQRQTHSL